MSALFIWLVVANAWGFFWFGFAVRGMTDVRALRKEFTGLIDKIDGAVAAPPAAK
ncbi:MAG TPA: hypothetical protein VMY35_02770 [Phycisphaerae bacterium]|nr:hypothetical protein [Phycisphaerae bacterium]